MGWTLEKLYSFFERVDSINMKSDYSAHWQPRSINSKIYIIYMF